MARTLEGIKLVALGAVVIPLTLAAAGVVVAWRIIDDEWKRFKSTAPRPTNSRPR